MSYNGGCCGCGSSSQTDAQLSDRLKYCSSNNNDERSTSFSQINELFNDTNGSLFVSKMVSQQEVPANGGSTQITDSDQNTHLIARPAATIASHTFVFPISSGSSPSTVDGQEIVVTTSNDISSVTFDGNGATVQGAPATMTADSFNRWRFDADFTQWIRIG